MKTQIVRFCKKLPVVFMIATFAVAIPLAQADSTNKRPVQDFVNSQGTFCFPFPAPLPPGAEVDFNDCVVFVPPVANFIGWGDPSAGRCLSVDYAGLADRWAMSVTGNAYSFGTDFAGSISERPLSDGRAEIAVRLQTSNALTWVAAAQTDDAGNFAGCVYGPDPSVALIFGQRAPDVLFNGKEPALGEVFLHLRFINTAPGAQLPDLLQLLADPATGQELLFISLSARADGELRGDFGVPDGSPGRLHAIQTGLFMTSFKGATADGFPAERVDLHRVGR